MKHHLPLADYWRQFGLEADPFPVQEKDALYLTPHWRQYIDFLLHTERYKKALLLVTGVAGAGKTTLAQHVYKQLQSQLIAVSLTATKLIPENFLSTLSVRFNVVDPNNSFDTTAELLDALRQTGKQYLLLIDNAEQLSPVIHELCLQMVKQQLAGESCLQIVLFGLPNLLQQFETIALQQHHSLHDPIIHTLKIKPFTLLEVQQYIKNRLERAGYNGRVTLFTKADFEEAYQESGGLPGRISGVARELILGLIKSDYVPPKPAVKLQPKSATPASPADRATASTVGNILDRSRWWLGILIVIAILLFWILPWLQNRQFNNNHNESILSFTHSQPNNAVAPPPAANPSTAAAVKPADENSVAATVTAPAMAISTLAPGISVPAGSHLVMGGNVTTVSSLPAPATVPATSKVSNPGKMPQLPVQKNETALEARERALTNQQLAQTSPIADNTSTMDSAAPAALPAPSASVSNLNTQSGATVPNIPYADLTDAEKRLLKVSDKMYTLQLFSTDVPDKVQQFVGQYNIGDLAATYRTIRHNQFAFIVILGYFPSKIEAQQAVYNLDPSIQKLHPWPRSFVSVHEDINKLMGQ